MTFPIKLTVLAAALPPAVYAESLEAILARMDRAAKDFRSVSATLKQSDYTAVIQDLSPLEIGQLRIRHTRNGLNAIVDFTNPETKKIVFKGDEAQMYYPKANSLQIVDLSKYMGRSINFCCWHSGRRGPTCARITM